MGEVSVSGSYQASTVTVQQQPVSIELRSAPYAGFWMRFLALVIDSIVFSPIFFVVGMVSGLGSAIAGNADSGMLGAVLAGMWGMVLLVCAVGGWLYSTLMESSRYQATLGKLALGLRVTDLNGNRISFARANGRYFGKWLSGMTFYIGFIMAAFTEKKQALHDLLAGCVILKRS